MAQHLLLNFVNPCPKLFDVGNNPQHKTEKSPAMKIQLERTSYYQTWIEPTLADLVSIENRAERNAKISAELDALNLESFDL